MRRSGLEPAGDAHPHLRTEFLGGLLAILGQNLGNGMRKSKGLPIGTKPKFGNLRNAFVSLPQKVIF